MTEYERVWGEIAEWLKGFKEFLGSRDWSKVYGASEKLMYLSQAKELLSIKGIAILSDDQSLPNADRLKVELKKQWGYHTARTMAYERSQQDILKAGFVKVVKEEK